MLITTLIGLLVAIASIALGQFIEGARISALLQPTSFLIVFGGTFGAVLSQSTPSDFMAAIKMLGWLTSPPVSSQASHITELVAYSKIAQREGALKLENTVSRIKDPLLKKGLEMVIDNYGHEYIRETLLLEVKIRDARLKAAARIWESAGGYSPTIGILGSVVGLLHVMDSLSDPSKLGEGVAVSFVATAYGLFFANLIFLPLAAKFRMQIFEITLRDEMRVEGIAMIAQSKQPHLVEASLGAFRPHIDDAHHHQEHKK
jgi:chemotaxis protein MotA